MIYFDQAAAMRPDPAVLDDYRRQAARCFANQEAGHRLGRALREELREAGVRLSRALTGGDWQVVYASTGTDLFALLAQLGDLPRGGSVAATALEHPALAAALRRLSPAVGRLPVGPDGRIATERIGEAVDASTGLVAFHHVQSELGVRQEVAAVAAALRQRAPRGRILLDAIQSAGRFALDFDVDFIAVSGHKLGAPGGAALLYRDEALTVQFEALRHRDYRIGRPEPAQVLALARAAELWCAARADRLRQLASLQELLRRRLAALPLPNGKRIVFTVPEEHASPYILHLLLPGYQAAVLMRMLAEREIFVASGSACQAESREPSPALRAIGVPARDGYAGLRLSFSFDNTPSEAEAFVDALAAVLRDY